MRALLAWPRRLLNRLVKAFGPFRRCLRHRLCDVAALWPGHVSALFLGAAKLTPKSFASWFF